MFDPLLDEGWLLVVQEELIKFKCNNISDLVSHTVDKIVIDTRWVFRYKMDENGVISRNKAILVAKGYGQAEGIYYEETYALVARLEAIRLLLEFNYCPDFKIFQMDIISSFLNNYINKEFYVSQPLGLGITIILTMFLNLKRAFYGIKQAQRAWYEYLSGVLIKKWFNHGKVDTILSIRRKAKHILLVQIYVTDIIFGTTNESLCQKFAKLM